MTTANISTHRGSCTFYCGGAQIRAHSRHLATIVTIWGEIDAGNAERIGEYIQRFAFEEKPVLLDMSEVTHFARAVIPLLHAFEVDCGAAGVEWILVANPLVVELLTGVDEAAFPIARSVHEALGNLADAIASRRRQLLPLIKKTA